MINWTREELSELAVIAGGALLAIPLFRLACFGIIRASGQDLPFDPTLLWRF